MKILFICSGGQNYLESPSEHLARYIIDNYDDIEIDMYNTGFKPPDGVSAKGYDLVWGEMDVGGAIQRARQIAKSAGVPCYLHGEWIPPYRIEEGWSEQFQTATNLSMVGYYMGNLKAMQTADLVSLAVGSTAGGFDYIKKKFNIEFDNKFLRYPACTKYHKLDYEKENAVATIARANDGKKRVQHTIEAIARSKSKPKFVLIGGEVGMKHPIVDIDSKGKWNAYNKVEIFAKSKLAVQHWSGIPPAEAIQQGCVVLSYDIDYMRELYGDALIWVKRDDIDALSKAIDTWLADDEMREAHAKKAYDMFVNGELGVKLQERRAELVVSEIRKLLASE